MTTNNNELDGDTCETCGDLIAGGNPFSRYCDKCWDATPLTNGTAIQENYYTVKFAGTDTQAATPYLWAYGRTALDAIAAAAADWTSEHRDTLGAAIVRPSVYKEWVNETWRYTNGGDFIRGPRTVN